MGDVYAMSPLNSVYIFSLYIDGFRIMSYLISTFYPFPWYSKQFLHLFHIAIIIDNINNNYNNDNDNYSNNNNNNI